MVCAVLTEETGQTLDWKRTPGVIDPNSAFLDATADAFRPGCGNPGHRNAQVFGGHEVRACVAVLPAQWPRGIQNFDCGAGCAAALARLVCHDLPSLNSVSAWWISFFSHSWHSSPNF